MVLVLRKMPMTRLTDELLRQQLSGSALAAGPGTESRGRSAHLSRQALKGNTLTTQHEPPARWLVFLPASNPRKNQHYAHHT
jgi:hypothetical protein